MRTTVMERLVRARRRRFVGRASELDLVRAALEAPEPPFAVLYVHGPGGVGKSALLARVAEVAAEAGARAHRVDLRGVEASPAGVRSALAEAAGAQDGDGRRVLLLDTFEALSGLEAWLAERLLPELDDGTLVVIASREPPGDRWATDPGWRDLMRVVSLRNLAPEDARELLRAEGVDPARHDRLVEVTHGHPLALALLVDSVRQSPGARVPDLADAPDVVRALLARFVEGVPSARHRAALEVCAHARATTEQLLRAALGGDDAAELFDWLCGLSFVEEGPDGLCPHDLARDVLDGDLRWRDRAAYAERHRRIRDDVLGRIRSTQGRAQQRATADLHFLHRANPGIRPFYDWESLGRAYADRLAPGDGDAVLALAARHETPESVALARFWLERQPGAFRVFREGAAGAPVGFAATLALHEAAPEDVEADPGARAMWAYAERHGPLRPGDECLAARFLVDAEAHQRPSPSLNLTAICSVQDWIQRPQLAWYFLGMWVDPEAIAPMMRHIDFHRAPEADYLVGGRRHGVFAHDWRRTPLEPWLELMAGRELADEPGGDEALAPGPVLALSHPEFAQAVRRALRELHRTGALAANPLCRTRVVRDRAGAEPAAEALEALLREAVAALSADPRERRLAQALDRTYLRPAATQEQAAAVLGLPPSTYRRHLARGIERVTQLLWQRELYGSW